MNMEHAVMLLADAGGNGIGTVHHVRVGARDANVVEFLFAFDTGSQTVGNFFTHNDSYCDYSGPEIHCFETASAWRPA
jgi:hypothetical protein